MLKTFALLSLVTIASASASISALAQNRGTPEQQKACGSDVSRYCRSVMQEGDFVILACLQQNRPKISKACDTMLKSHGQ